MTLRSRVLAGIALIAAVLCALGVLIVQTTRARMVEQIDDQLASSAETVRDLDLDAGEARGPHRDQPPDLSTFYVGVVDGDTVRTQVTPDLRGDDNPLPVIDADEAIDAADEHRPFTTGSAGDLRYRVLAYLDPHADAVVVVALPLDGVDDTLGTLVAAELVGGAVIALTLGLVTWWVIHLGVRPVRNMTTAAATIAEGDISHRVPETNPRTEAGQLGVALNRMLGRIEEAFAERTRSEARLRQFVADASHELHTPIATIRGYAELYRRGGLDDRNRLDDAQRRTEQEAIRMARLVDDLFLLAQLDERRPLAADEVDLSQLARDAATDARAVEPRRPVTAVTNGPVLVVGDEGRLRQVLANLTANARVHTPETTPVEIKVEREGATAVVEVTDQGPGMSPAHAAQAFERFYRADPARSRRNGGSGLGLSIVAAAVEAHAGTTRLRTAPGEGTTVRIELPATTPEAQPAVRSLTTAET